MKRESRPEIAPGMLVYSAADNPMGTVDGAGGDYFQVNGISIPFYEIARMERYGIYLTPRGTELFKQRQRIPAANQPTHVQGYTTVLKMGYSKEEVFPGVDVVDLNGHSIGRVKEAKATYFTVDRLLSRDYEIPYVAVLDASGSRVVLRVVGSKLDNLEFERPKLEVGINA